MNSQHAQRISKIGGGLLVAVLLLVVSALLVAHRQGYGIYSVRSDSMEPVLAKGSLLVISKKDRAVSPGDVVSYLSPKDPRLVVTHRVVGVYPRHGVFVAQGDNTSRADDPVPLRNLLGTAVFKIPFAGYGLEALRHPAGLAVIVYVPALGIILAEVGRLKQHYTTTPKRRYVLYDY